MIELPFCCTLTSLVITLKKDRKETRSQADRLRGKQSLPARHRSWQKAKPSHLNLRMWDQTQCPADTMSQISSLRKPVHVQRGIGNTDIRAHWRTIGRTLTAVTLLLTPSDNVSMHVRGAQCQPIFEKTKILFTRKGKKLEKGTRKFSEARCVFSESNHLCASEAPPWYKHCLHKSYKVESNRVVELHSLM